MSTQLKDKVAIVTGAGQGIGKAIAFDLASNGAAVLVTDLDYKSAQKTRTLIGTNSEYMQVDVANLDDVQRMIDTCLKKFSKLDILINNAGVTRFVDIMGVTVEDWDLMHSVNARGTFFAMQFAAKQMIETKTSGNIINIASIAGKGWHGSSNAAYAASKGAIIAMTTLAAQQLGRYGIRVNAVCPGTTQTGLLDRIVDSIAESHGVKSSEVRKSPSRISPTGRDSTPEDIASMVTFLVGPGASNITGQAINVDGGLISH